MTEIDALEAEVAAAQAVALEFGALTVALIPKSGGVTNRVFEAHLSQGQIIVRLGSDANKVAIFEAERHAIARAGEAGIPVPQVFAVGEIGGWGYMISQHISGGPAMHHPSRLQILEDLGRLATRIHAIRMEDFGGTICGTAGATGSPSWRTWFIDEFKAEARLGSLAGNGMLSLRQQEILEATLRSVAAWDGPPVLNHGDLRLKNVIVDTAGSIQGLIDWECSIASIGSDWDLSIALHDLSIDAKEVFLKGYGLTPNAASAATPIWRLFNVLNYAPIVETAVAENDTVALAWLRARLGGAFELYGA